MASKFSMFVLYHSEGKLSKSEMVPFDQNSKVWYLPGLPEGASVLCTSNFIGWGTSLLANLAQ